MDWARLVQEVLDEARRNAGSGPALATALEQAGVGPENGRYSESGISNWIKGRTMPPADVLLASAHVGGISLDQKIRGDTPSATAQSDDSAIGDLRHEVQELRRQYGRLETVVIDLYSRTGQPYPHERGIESRGRQATGA